MLIVEILSPSNRAETWVNVRAYTSIPSVQEILMLSSTEIRAYTLRREADGSWPDIPSTTADGDLVPASVGLTVALARFYRTTRLARPA